jgi:hypothetical protein
LSSLVLRRNEHALYRVEKLDVKTTGRGEGASGLRFDVIRRGGR